MREKGLWVVDAKGKALPFALLPVAEHYARELVKKGRGPVEVVSRYTNAVLATFTGDAENVYREEGKD